MAESVTSCAPQFTLSEGVDTYLIQRGVQNKKYYPAYLTSAFRAWKDIFQKVLYVQGAKWMELKHDGHQFYIDAPFNIARFLAVNTVDDCGELVPLYYNSQLNTIPEPNKSDCGCSACGCNGGVCDDVSSTIMTEKVLFSISGVDYKEKKWIKYCKNGDIIEYTETPVKKYKNIPGSPGDFSPSDYNDDYLIGTNGMDDMTIVYLQSQKIICKLKTKPCGCPEDTQENVELLNKNCGCYLCYHKKKCYPVSQNVNNNHFGEVKMSECGTKIYYYPPHKNHCHPKFKMPTHLQVSYQVSGATVNEEIIVPDVAQVCLWYGIDYYSKVFNNKYSLNEKEFARIQWEREKQELILVNNPIRFSDIFKAQDTVIRW